jgi:hypothetical protein
MLRIVIAEPDEALSLWLQLRSLPRWRSRWSARHVMVRARATWCAVFVPRWCWST